MKKSFKVTAETGIHARPATILVNEAVKYSSDITLEVEGRKINMKSIMGVMSLGVYYGSIITINAEGQDAEQALMGIEDVIYQLRLGKEF